MIGLWYGYMGEWGGSLGFQALGSVRVLLREGNDYEGI